jgi:hypothetical protein
MVREAVDDLFKAVNTTGYGTNSKSLDSLFNILDSILTHPYVDSYRIIDLSYFKSKFSRFPQAIKLLKEIGFKQGSNSSTYVFPFDQTFPKMLIAKEMLTSKVVKR